MDKIDVRPMIYRGASCVRKIFDAITVDKFPMPICKAIPTLRLHCPAKLFPSLHTK